MLGGRHPLLFNYSPTWNIATPHIELGHNPHNSIMTVEVSELHSAISTSPMVVKGGRHREAQWDKKKRRPFISDKETQWDKKKKTLMADVFFYIICPSLGRIGCSGCISYR